MDSLTLQRSIAILEDRYRELREMGEKQLQVWADEKDALLQQIKQQKDALQDAKYIREKHVKRIETLQSELQALRNERDAAYQKQMQAEEQLTSQRQALQRLREFVQEPLPIGT